MEIDLNKEKIEILKTLVKREIDKAEKSQEKELKELGRVKFETMDYLVQLRCIAREIKIGERY